ncbi:hypothetical protein [Saccharopolyspora oryzae]|uniref:Uncharacterized protein n=1 Tax=Saccharopolyspora oryzae TaxID=2997343 RepID=A0ABT4V6Q1_9PSEU|nr:hypothetical protein [Saccharopolyspora oryzae]MDA3629523.1 hypothetical protein [Saccharopolyspora oryzae]
MQARQEELARLYRAALDRPRWQQVLAFAVSLWALVWILGQFVLAEESPSALDVLGHFVARLGMTTGEWAERLSAAWQSGGGALAVLGGLLWAATTERGQVPALLGWVAVMIGAERLGYQPAVLLAVATMVCFVVVLWVASLTSVRFVDRHAVLLPRDVVRAGVTAAALSAVVPLFAPAFFLNRLSSPYVTKPPHRPRIPEQTTPADAREPELRGGE